MLGRFSRYAIAKKGIEVQTAWVLLAALVGYSFAKRHSKVVAACRKLCVLLSPAMIIILVQLFFLINYPPRLDTLPSRSDFSVLPIDDTVNPARPVYLFVFDEWSYERSYDEGRLRPAFENLAALSEQSTVFHDAHAPGTKTEESLPRILFQTDLPVIVEGGKTGFERDGSFVPSREFESIFSATSSLGYRSLLIGFSLPYGTWLNDQVDVVRSYCYYARGHNVPSKLAVHAFNAMHYSTDLWTRRRFKRIEGQVLHSVIADLVDRSRRDILRVIREQPRNTFGFFHYHCPHPPYMFNPDGSYRSAEDTLWHHGSVAGYESSLAAVDTLVGEFTTAMKEVGSFEDALIIVTSDHSWRKDPDRKSGRQTAPVTHVPLIVKLPGQDSSFQVASRFDAKNLGGLIEAALVAGATPEQVEGWVSSGIVDADLARRLQAVAER